MNWFSRMQQRGEPLWLWGLATVGALALLALVGWLAWQVWTLRLSPRLALGNPTPTAQPVPIFTPTPQAVALGTPAPGTPAPGAEPVAIVTAAGEEPPPPAEPPTPTAVPPLEAQQPVIPAQRTITLDDIAPGAADSPTPTPGPPTPTPAVPPSMDAQLAQGVQFHRLGDYVAARSRLAALINDPATSPAVRLEARVYLVKGYWADGFATEALAVLDQVDADLAAGIGTTARTGPRVDLATESLILRGLILSSLGRTADAIAAYDQALARYPQLAALLQPRRARAFVALNDSVNAAAAYRAAVDAATDTVQQVGLLELLAATHSGAGRYAEAVAAYDEILAVARNAPYRAQMQYQAGEIYALAGDLTSALSRWRAATDEAPSTTYGYRALVRLVEQQADFDLVRRGQINLAAQSWQPAVNAFTAYVDTAPADDPRRGEALHGLGQAYLGLGNATAAREILDRVIAEVSTCTCFGQAWLDKARAQAAAGDGPGARRTYRTFARDHADDPLAPEALWRSGALALSDNSPAEAAIDWLTLADAFPASDRAPQALYTVGVGAFANGLPLESADALARAQRTYPDYRWDAVGYWLGRARAAQGDRAGAEAAWQAVVDRAPDIYFGVLSAQAIRQFGYTDGAMVNLSNIAAIIGPPSRVAGDDGSQAFAEQWLADWLQVDATTLAQLPAAVADDPDWVAGQLLLAVDERGDGLVALERVYTRHRDDSRTLYALSLAYERMGAYRLSLISMARLLAFSPAGLVENAPRFLQERVFPRRFADLITAEATTYGIAPYVLFSLIRQESLFEEGARSVAAAQGLAQIIPDTGAWVAQRLSYPNYTNDLVYRPYINVKFGAYYLDWARGYLDGNLVSALAGYNAGPGNSEVWRTRSGPDDALFVEQMAFSEPRIYIQAVVANLYHYTRLYGAP